MSSGNFILPLLHQTMRNDKMQHQVFRSDLYTLTLYGKSIRFLQGYFQVGQLFHCSV
uniref:Uncharacterized protein n=1 Tax=Setaria italica TaxID=4555 RepID=K3Z1L6_SETIT